MPAPRPQISPAELETLVVDLVTEAGQPMTVTEIHRKIQAGYRPTAKAVSAIVSKLAGAKRLFRVGRRYSAQPDRTLHEGIVRLTQEEALTASELAKKLRASAARVRKVIDELVESGELHAYPKQDRVIRYGAHPPTPAALLRPELARLLASAKKLGISEADAKDALRELLGGVERRPLRPRTDEAETIVDTLRELNPDGALVYLPHLRTALASSFRDKPSFDRAVLGLLARGTIQLQSHPTPSMLGAAERNAMIEDGRGGYFSAIGLR